MVAQYPDKSDMTYEIGKRIDCGGHLGTIKYIGPVEGHPGEWLGIDWDDQERGKHNGSVNGVHYFDTRLPKSGSLVKKENVNLGQTILDSIRTRYGYRDSESSAQKAKEELIKVQQKINAPFLQFVGFEEVAEKQRDFRSLEIVNVRLQNVSSIGDFANVCPNIREIDISKNLISSWTDVFSICSQLKHLYWLNLSENLLSMPENAEKRIFPNITVLVCGTMELTFEDVNKISAIFPNIEELRVPFNHITSLTVQSDHNFRRLRYLDLEGNDIRFWTEVVKLSAIKTLEHLHLENIKLERIRFEENVPVNHFNKLEALNINNNLISEWRSIAELNKLESLQHLRFLKNPVLETENERMRVQIVIGMIKNLKSYNGTHILREEKKGAEYDYLKRYALSWMKCLTDEEKADFLIEHNRFSELIELHGLPEESELIIKPNIIETSLVNLRFEYKDKIIFRKLPKNILVQKVIPLIQKMFKLKERPVLMHSRPSRPDILIKLSEESKELHFYSVEDGDTLIVQDE